MDTKFMQGMIDAASPEDVMNVSKGREHKSLGDLLGFGKSKADKNLDKYLAGTLPDPSAPKKKSLFTSKGAASNLQEATGENTDTVETMLKKKYSPGTRPRTIKG